MKLRKVLSAPVLIALPIFLLTIGAHLALRVSTPESAIKRYFGFFERLEWIAYDWRVRLGAQASPENLSAVFIEDRSIEDIGSGLQPLGYAYGLYWPRHLFGQITRELKAQQAKAVAFDILFGQLRSDHQGLSDWVLTNTGLSPDEFFADQMKRAGNVILASTRDVIPPPLFRTNAWGLGDISSERDADGVIRRIRAFHDYPRLWHPEILDLVRKLNLDLDNAIIATNRILIPRTDKEAPYEVPLKADGALDMEEFGHSGPLPPQKPFETLRVWNMGITLAAFELKLDLSRAEIDLNRGRIVLRGPGGAERTLPVDRDGYFVINWRIPDLARQNEFHHVLALDYARQQFRKPRNDPRRWKDKLVIVGSRATGNDLTDLGPTPLAQGQAFLVSKYWNVADSIISDRFIPRSPWWLDLGLIGGLCALAAALVWSFPALWALFWTACLAGFYVAICSIVFTKAGYWLPVALPLAGSLGATYLCLQTYRVLFEQRERRHMRSRFARLVSPDVVNEILKAPSLTLSARRDLTVLFADVRGFTEFTDASQASAEAHARDHQMSKEETSAHLDAQARVTLETVNLYLGAIADTVKKFGGTLDKYIGDCVMAFWGAPLPQERHAVSCVRAAIEAQRQIARINEQRTAENKRLDEENLALAKAGQPLKPLLAVLVLGTGINTGKMTVGFMGSNHHLVNYTVFGREVNIANRLEGASGKGRIFISESTYRELMRDDPPLAASCVELTPVPVKGIREPVRAYEVPWQDR